MQDMHMTEAAPSETSPATKKAKAAHMTYMNPVIPKDSVKDSKNQADQQPFAPAQDPSPSTDEAIPPYLDPAAITADYLDWKNDQTELDKL